MYRQKELTECFLQWEKHLKEQKIPDWDSLPTLELYMDQVLVLLNRYADIMRISGGENIITAPMINNYVKHKTVPAPVKKRYSRYHLAYLIMVCTLKQALSIATIEKIIPNGLSEDEVKHIYNSFAKNQQKAFSYVSEQVLAVSRPIITAENYDTERVRDLVFQVAIASNIFKNLTETITDLPEDKQ
ncbi:MAG: DUF1836 domain-containing protein [Clostridia bacterium]|nr:DUF1836 domain-containing protein [Clostridia bacterium]